MLVSKRRAGLARCGPLYYSPAPRWKPSHGHFVPDLTAQACTREGPWADLFGRGAKYRTSGGAARPHAIQSKFLADSRNACRCRSSFRRSRG